MKIEDNVKKKVLDNPVIKKLIEDLNLNQNQIESGIHLFIKIIEEQKKIKELDFLTKIEIYDENSIIGVSVPNKEINKSLKINKYFWLNDITKIEKNIIFGKPKNKENFKLEKNIFYWEYPTLKRENNRNKLGLWFKQYYTNLQNNKYIKGVYIYGKFGLGKSFFLKALTNYLIEKKKNVIFVNTVDLYEKMIRNLEKNSDVNYEIIQKMKKVDILIIDDIGSEKQNSWFLFSTLYPILENRLQDEKTTCFSSLFSLNELKKYWLKGKEMDLIRVERLIEKIRSLTIPIHLEGKNIREL